MCNIPRNIFIVFSEGFRNYVIPSCEVITLLTRTGVVSENSSYVFPEILLVLTYDTFPMSYFICQRHEL